MAIRIIKSLISLAFTRLKNTIVIILISGCCKIAPKYSVFILNSFSDNIDFEAYFKGNLIFEQIKLQPGPNEVTNILLTGSFGNSNIFVPIDSIVVTFKSSKIVYLNNKVTSENKLALEYENTRNLLSKINYKIKNTKTTKCQFESEALFSILESDFK